VPVALDTGGRVRCDRGVTNIANREQADAWNGDEGAHWAANADRYNASTAVYDHPLFAAVRIQPTDVVLDVGCGCGSTTRAAARHASAGSATGVDLSAPMLDVARAQAEAEGLTNVTFTQADAQVETFPPEYDAVISRFGAMFFGDLAAAFANLGRALEPGGRLGVVAWTSVDRNEWLTAIRAALAAGRDLPAPPPGVPGPFGLGDRDRTRAWLTAAGFRSIDLEEVQGAFFAGRRRRCVRVPRQHLPGARHAPAPRRRRTPRCARRAAGDRGGPRDGRRGSLRLVRLADHRRQRVIAGGTTRLVRSRRGGVT
jgi:SAM-dependent methyltransferase